MTAAISGVIEAARAACSGDTPGAAGLRLALAAYDRSRPDILDEPNRMLIGSRGRVRLPTQAVMITAMLLRSAGSMVSMEAILDRLYGDDRDGGPDAPIEVARNRITTLRRAIKQCGAPLDIITIWGAGFRLELLEKSDNGPQ